MYQSIRSHSAPFGRYQPLLLPGLLLGGAVLSLACVLIYYTSHTTPSTWLPSQTVTTTSSPHAGLVTRTVRRHTPAEHSVVEYPITQYHTINQHLAITIDQFDIQFKQIVRRGQQFPEPLTQHIGYQIHHHSARFLSLSIHIQQQLGGPAPLVTTLFTTYDTTTQRPLRLADVFHTPHAMQQFQQYAADAPQTPVQSAAPLRQRHQRPAHIAEGFIATDSDTISVLLQSPSTTGAPIEQAVVSLPINQFTSLLQSSSAAKALFNIPEPYLGSCRDVKCIALTFDDGPGPYTDELLDILERHQARSTFFVLGSKVASGTTVLKQMRAAGHQIGNHSWRHPVLPNLSPEAIRNEIISTNQAIQATTGQSPTTLRPPYGATDPVVYEQLKTLGLPAILWSVDTRDWADHDSQLVCKRAVAGAHRGAIILLHDIHKTSVKAVPCIASHLQKQGYKLVTLDRLFGHPLEPGHGYTTAD